MTADAASSMAAAFAAVCELLGPLFEVEPPGLDGDDSEHPLRPAARRSSELLGSSAVSRARATFFESSVAVAVFGADRMPTVVNTAWMRMFRRYTVHTPVWLPPEADAVIDEVIRSGRRAILKELPFDLGSLPSSCMMTIDVRRCVVGSPLLVAMCVDTTDHTIARRLGLAVDVPVCSGESCFADHFNRAWYAYTGWTAPVPWRNAFHPDDRDRAQHIRDHMMFSRTLVEIEARMRRADGSYHDCHLRFSRLEHARRWYCAVVEREIRTDQHVTQVVYAPVPRMHELITPREARQVIAPPRADIDLESATRAQDRFLAAVSHELRAPLMTMLVWEKLLRDSPFDDELRAQALSAIHDSAVMQARLVGDLLDSSRAALGKLHVDLRPLELAHLVDEAIDAIAPAITSKGIRLVLALDPQLGVVRGDAGRLRQILDNLLSNALKFTNSGGTIRVSTHHSATQIHIAITDTGCGIEKDFLPQLFVAFRQEDDSLSRGHGGLGLGLAIAHQLVGLHNGSLDASSPGRNHGATFTMKLPRAGESAPLARVRTSVAHALDHLQLLLIEDDERMRDGLAHLLRRAGAIVTTAPSADLGRAQIAAGSPSLIICDIGMPAEDGYSFTRRLRATGCRIPVIALTGHTSDADIRRARDAGCDRHLAKPVELATLIAAIQDILTPAPPPDRVTG
jgi:signal transduction histidine kinase/CheY-like chemotaxis protein